MGKVDEMCAQVSLGNEEFKDSHRINPKLLTPEGDKAKTWKPTFPGVSWQLSASLNPSVLHTQSLSPSTTQIKSRSPRGPGSEMGGVPYLILTGMATGWAIKAFVKLLCCKSQLLQYKRKEFRNSENVSAVTQYREKSQEKVGSSSFPSTLDWQVHICTVYSIPATETQSGNFRIICTSCGRPVTLHFCK